MISLAERCESSEKMYTERLYSLSERLEQESAKTAESESQLHARDAILQEVTHLMERCGYCSSDLIESCRSLTEHVNILWEWCSAKVSELQESSEVDLFELFDIAKKEDEGLVASSLSHCRVVVLTREREIVLLTDKNKTLVEEKALMVRLFQIFIPVTCRRN